MTKRTGFLQLEEIPLNKVGLSIRAYGKKKNVGRVEINHAGLAAFTGPKSKKCIANLELGKTIRPVEYAKATPRPLEFSLAKGATFEETVRGQSPVSGYRPPKQLV